VQDSVAAILSSETFRRSDQLKRLILYLVEQAEQGRIHEVTEYELGTKALGRPQDFSPDTDSTVRTRMHSLRLKLDEYYRKEAPNSPVRIGFPKGSYRPAYETLAPSEEPVEKPQEAPGHLPSRKKFWWALAGLPLAVAPFLWPRRSALDSLWLPVVRAPQPAALLVGQPLHVWVRDVQGQAEPLDYPHFPDEAPRSPAFTNFVRPRLNSNSKLALHPSPNATLWGDAAGAAAAARFLAFRQAHSDLLPESTLRSNTLLRGRPVLAFGRPEFSPAIQRYLEAAGGYTVGMLNSIRRYAIYRPESPADHFVNTAGSNEVNHGLATVMTDGDARVFVFSGITSDGSMASLDFLTNEASVNELWQRLGARTWPTTFQVVVKITSSRGYPMGARYEKHLLLRE
jgi:hypothetical protein